MTNTTWTRTVPLRWRDFDPLGHMYHGEYLALFDEVRTPFLDELVLDGTDYSYVLGRIEIDYVSEIAHGTAKTVDVEVTVQRIGSKSIRTREVMRRPDGEVAARIEAVSVLWDPEARGSAALTDAQRAALEPYLEG
ncbi:acyl-CoA thioesterase [Brevibacterium litoralis]|uniref:acyl-CoA thioesterase n=1 Tax=Brevibacterium litoralis TaxID=3138935 RepID=UPI0032EAD788